MNCYQGTQFIKGWEKAPTLLGEGAFGEVHLLTNQTTGEAVAMKVIDTRISDTVLLQARKEFTIHRRLEHDNVVRVYGVRKEMPLMYLFMEYASGGELYDKIEPDVGLSQTQAQRYFRQLIAGMDYLHQLGIAHRDLKPENILLDSHDNVKISDFGMATIFKLNDEERKLEKRCGTLPYVAPEVLRGPYRAEPADIWSCGIILVAMLTGELPWDEPTLTQKEYRNWRDSKASITRAPWTKLDPLALSLLQRILQHCATRRVSIASIRESAWFSRTLRVKPCDRVSAVVCDSSLGDCHYTRLACSQPVPTIRHSVSPISAPITATASTHHSTHTDDVCVSTVSPGVHEPCFSQPAVCAEDLLLGSQFHTTQSSGAGTNAQNLMQKLVRRMTRFFVSTDERATLQLLNELFDSLGYTWRVCPSQTITVQTFDRRKIALTFKVNLLEMSGRVLVDFRLSKGCGLDFKRQFICIKHKLADIVLNVPLNWSMAVATNSVP